MAKKGIYVGFGHSENGRDEITFIGSVPLQRDVDGRVYVMAISDDAVVHLFLKPGTFKPSTLEPLLEKWRPGKWRFWKK